LSRFFIEGKYSSHGEGLSEKYSCKICNIDFDTKEELEAHNKKVHGKPKKDDKKKKN